MRITKAVITAAARGGRLFPMADTVQKAMLPIIDKDGIQKNTIQIIAEEALESGIEEICIICAPGDDVKYKEYFHALELNLRTAYSGYDWAINEANKLKEVMNSLQFIEQTQPQGYGHAVLLAKDFVKDNHFLLLSGDYLYVSDTPQRCAKQLIDIAIAQNCSVSAVTILPEYLITNYGTLTGKHVLNEKGLYEIEKIIEKPSLSIAELELQTTGIRNGYYLCFFGMHVLNHQIFRFLEEALENAAKTSSSLLLTPCLQQLANTEKYLAAEIKGKRYDLSKKFGLFEAQLALALAGSDKELVLSKIVSVMAENQ